MHVMKIILPVLFVKLVSLVNKESITINSGHVTPKLIDYGHNKFRIIHLNHDVKTFHKSSPWKTPTRKQDSNILNNEKKSEIYANSPTENFVGVLSQDALANGIIAHRNHLLQFWNTLSKDTNKNPKTILEAFKKLTDNIESHEHNISPDLIKDYPANPLVQSLSLSLSQCLLFDSLFTYIYHKDYIDETRKTQSLGLSSIAELDKAYLLRVLESEREEQRSFLGRLKEVESRLQIIIENKANYEMVVTNEKCQIFNNLMQFVESCIEATVSTEYKKNNNTNLKIESDLTPLFDFYYKHRDRNFQIQMSTLILEKLVMLNKNIYNYINIVHTHQLLEEIQKTVSTKYKKRRTGKQKAKAIKKKKKQTGLEYIYDKIEKYIKSLVKFGSDISGYVINVFMYEGLLNFYNNFLSTSDILEAKANKFKPELKTVVEDPNDKEESHSYAIRNNYFNNYELIEDKGDLEMQLDYKGHDNNNNNGSGVRGEMMDVDSK